MAEAFTAASHCSFHLLIIVACLILYASAYSLGHVDNYAIAYVPLYGKLHDMAKQSPKFVIIRIMDSTRTRLKVKAARRKKKIYQVVDEMSLSV